MLSIRTLTRSIPRAAFRSSSASLRRPLSTFRKPSLLQSQSIWQRAPGFKPAYPAFSTSQAMRELVSEGDQRLSLKIQEEWSLEQDVMSKSDKDGLKSSIQEFIDSDLFTIQDVPGQEEVVLTRQIGNEEIKVTFSIADINALAEDPDLDSAQEDEMEDVFDTPQSGGANSKGAINQGRTGDGNIAVAPEDQVAPADSEEAGIDESQPSFPFRVNVEVKKAGQGTMTFETVANYGMINIESIVYTPENIDSKVKAGMYEGPPFSNLDENLQFLWEGYLEDRGIDSRLATFVPDYAEYKEQKEYVNWLNNAKQFIDS